MGGNVAMLYAGIRPERVRKLINLEGFGLPNGSPEQAPNTLRQWLDQAAQQRQGGMSLKPYASREAVAKRLMKTNPRLPEDKALWLAGVWAEQTADGQWQILVDSAHKVASHTVYRVEEIMALYREISADVLALEATESSLATYWDGVYTVTEYHQRLHNIAKLRIATVDHAGHNLHHDQPERIAQYMKDFLA